MGRLTDLNKDPEMREKMMESGLSDDLINYSAFKIDLVEAILCNATFWKPPFELYMVPMVLPNNIAILLKHGQMGDLLRKVLLLVWLEYFEKRSQDQDILELINNTLKGIDGMGFKGFYDFLLKSFNMKKENDS